MSNLELLYWTHLWNNPSVNKIIGETGNLPIYLPSILDAFTKQILSYVVSDSLEVDFVLDTVTKLINNHGSTLQAEAILHSDQGFHYTSYRFIEIIKDKKLRQSMSRRGICWDNVPQEIFHGHMKDYIGEK